ncbi:hypothetical protein, partial [Acinetobacter baumannii]|uniref:hypothetical protein n=1 Tax=Acinetobacter baumannii TaxID=470 RepID=UPI001BB46ECA
AYARVQASRNSLASTLGISRDDAGNQDLVRDWQSASDAAQRCPVTTVDATSASRDELDARARELAGPAVVTPVAAPAAVAAKAEAPMADEAAAETVAQRLR